MAAEAVPEVLAGSEAASAGGAAADAAGGGAAGTGYFGAPTAAPKASQAGKRIEAARARAETRAYQEDARRTAAAKKTPAPASKGPSKRSGSRGRKTYAQGVVGAPTEAPSLGRPLVGVGSDIHFDVGVGWHRVVMAEFLFAILVLVLAPILTPDQSGSSKGFFKAADIVRMTAVCLVYFILALMSNGQKLGKAAAAFGGLVLTGIVINNATGTESIFAAIASIFSSAFGANNASLTTEVSDPDLVYGQVGANVFQQLTAGGTPTPGATSTTAPATGVAAATPAGAAPTATAPAGGQ